MPSKAAIQKKLEEEERRKAELKERAQGIANKLYRQHEMERLTTEKADRERAQREYSSLGLERERISQEKQEYKSIGLMKNRLLDISLKEFKKHQSWRNIIPTARDGGPMWLPDVESEADINAFLSVWEDDDNSSGEGVQRDMHKDLAAVTEAYELTQRILEARDALQLNVVSGDKATLVKTDAHRRNCINVYNMMLTKIDQMTANILHYLDQYIDRDEEQGVTICKDRYQRQVEGKMRVFPAAVGYGLWAGDRRARHRSIDFKATSAPSDNTDLKICVAPKEGAHLPTALELVKDRGIRVMQFPYDPFSLRSGNMRPIEEDGSEYYALGCILVVECLQYPKPPAQTGHWTLRTEGPLAKGLRRCPYPPPDADQGSAKPIKIQFPVPERVVVRHRHPFIGIWNQHECCWDFRGTSEYNYKKDDRVASFATQYLGITAIIQDKGFDVPYDSWHMYPKGDDEVMYVIVGKLRGEISDREVHILIRGQRCKVVEPQEQELDYLREEWYTPATLLRKLGESGYLFTFSDADAQFFPDVKPKTKALEAKAYKDIAHFCTAHAFASSKHNAARIDCAIGNVPEDPSMALFRISKETRSDATAGTPFSRSDAEPENDGKWNCVRYEEHRCAFCQCKEGDHEADMRDAQGSQTHLNLYKTLSAAESSSKTLAEEIVKPRYLQPDHLLLHQAVFEILSLTRPLSFG